MKAIILAAAAAIITLVSMTSAEAARRATGLHPECNVTMPCAAPQATRSERRAHRPVKVARRLKRARYAAHRAAKPRAAAVTPVDVITAPVRAAVEAGTMLSAPVIAAIRAGGRSLVGVIEPLASKAEALMTACPGAKVVSGVRHTRVRGRGRWSLHRYGRAVDMAGDPACLYRNLADWPGGYTTDYHRVRHVHISYGGSEHGLRFAHGGGRKKYARHRHHRYAAR